MTEAANPASSDSSLRVDRVNLAVDADVAQWTRVRNEVGVALLGGDAQLTSVEIVRAMAQRSDQVRELYLARDAGQVVGAGSFLLPGGPGDTDAEVWVGVLPEGRRGGVGSAVVAAMEARARELGCSRVVLDQTSPREDGLPGSQFCVAMGCRQSQLVLGLRLDLPVPAGTLTPLQERATSASDAAYEILTAWDEIPADWLDDRAHLASELSTEAPDAAIDHDGEHWDAERVRTLWLSRLAGGGRAVESVAIDRATGQLVAFSDLVAYASMPHVASQSDTVVLDEHRGHRLGLAVKLANLRTLAEELPDITAVRTWTAIDNTHMLAINRELGFRVVEWTRMWVKEL
jgi:GNAT superfamily N-acetyltransferase